MSDGFQSVSLAEIAVFRNGKALPANEYRADGEYPVYGSNGLIGYSDHKLTDNPVVVIGRVGANCGSVHRVRSPSWVSDNAIVAEPSEDTDFDFLYYRLVSLALGRTAVGSAQPLVTQSALKLVKTCVPSLTEQRRIAHILGTLDDKIELNRRMNRTLEAIARAIFKSWFVDFDPVHAKAEGREPVGMDPETAALFPDSFQDSPLGKIPSGWEVETLGDLCEQPQYGYTESAKEEPVGPHFLRITDINKQPWIEWDSVPYCKISDDNYTKYRLKLGDIVVARIADPGYAALIEQDIDAVFASYLIRFRPLDQRYGRYIQYWQRSAEYWDLVNARRSGSTRGNLNARVLSEFPILVIRPQLAERFAMSVAPLRTRIEANLDESGVLARERDILLPRLLSGTLSLGGPAESETTRGD